MFSNVFNEKLYWYYLLFNWNNIRGVFYVESVRYRNNTKKRNVNLQSSSYLTVLHRLLPFVQKLFEQPTYKAYFYWLKCEIQMSIYRWQLIVETFDISVKCQFRCVRKVWQTGRYFSVVCCSLRFKFSLRNVKHKFEFKLGEFNGL